MRVLKRKTEGRLVGTGLEYVGLDFILGAANTTTTKEEFPPIAV